MWMFSLVFFEFHTFGLFRNRKRGGICTARRVSRARAACARVREEPRWSRRDGNRFSDSYHHEDILNFNQARFIFVLAFTGYD